MSEVLSPNREPVETLDEAISNKKNNQTESNENKAEKYGSIGEKIFFEICNFEEKVKKDYYISPELNQLFSTLTDEPDDSGFEPFKHKFASFTTLGIEYNTDNGPVRYSYNPEFRKRIHLNVLHDELNGIKDKEAAIAKLEKTNESWQPKLKALYRTESRKRIDEKYKRIKDPLEHKLDKLKQKNLGYQIDGRGSNDAEDYNARKELATREYERIDKEIVDSGMMTKEELERYHSFNQEKSVFIERYRAVMESKRYAKDYKELTEKYIKAEEKRKIKEEEDKKKGEIDEEKKKIDEELRRIEKEKNRNKDIEEAERKAQNYGERQANLIKKYISLSGLYEIDKLDGKYERPELIAKQIKKEITTNVDRRIITHFGMETKILNEINTLFGDTEQAKNLCKETKNFLTRADEYFAILSPKYHEFANKSLYPDYEQINDLKAQISATKKEYRKTASEKSAAEAEKMISELKTKIGRIAFPQTEKDPEDIYFFATGIVALYDDGIKINPISPLDKRIVQEISQPRAIAFWRQNWFRQQSRYDSLTRNMLSSMVEEIQKNPQNEFEKRKKALLDKYNIAPPPIFNAGNGNVYDTLQPADLNLLEDILPYIGDFINGVVVDYGDGDTSLKSTRIEVLNYLSGGLDLSNSQLYDSTFNLKIRSGVVLSLNSGPEKSDKVLNRIVLETAVALYNSLTPKKREEFNELVGTNANVSSMDFYKLYRRRIMDATERRNTVVRSFFLKSFLDYTKGGRDTVLTSFIDSLKKQHALG